MTDNKDTPVLPLAARQRLWDLFWDDLLARALVLVDAEVNEDEDEQVAA